MTVPIRFVGGDVRADQLWREVQFRWRAKRSGEHVCDQDHDTPHIRAGQPCPVCKARL